MRNAFIKTLGPAVERDPNIMLLTGDLGFTVFEDFAAKHPDQFLNCGVAEQNMMGIAAGLAMSGKKVFVYTIIPFLTMRAFEQVRDDICLHNLDIVLVGVGGGYSYGFLGPTHHSIEDVSLMRSLPNMKVLVPADPAETVKAVEVALTARGPVYLRLGKSKEEDLHSGDFDFGFEKANILREGGDCAIITAGPVLKNVLAAADLLAASGVQCRVLSMASIKPLAHSAVRDAAGTKRVITVEEHSVIGGLGDAVLAYLAESGLLSDCRVKKIGVGDRFMTIAGDQDYLRKENGLSGEKIAETVKEFLAGS